LTSVTWVGHSTVLIESGGTRLLTDPVLRRRLGHLRRIASAPRDEDLRDLDAVLISHAHVDHLDPPSLERVARSCPVFAPPGCGAPLRRRGIEATELEPGEGATVGAVEVLAVRAEHGGRRHPFWRGRTTLAYMIEAERRIFFAGDTDLFDGLGDLAGNLDLALLPIWGWGPRVGPGHLDPKRAAQAAALLEPRAVVPIHWGTLASPGVRWLADPVRPARTFAEAVSRAAPGVRVHLLAPGQRLDL
jgi:L-ascorbate metabolism protein UlaG (beta-lactamase superfamily)